MAAGAGPVGGRQEMVQIEVLIHGIPRPHLVARKGASDPDLGPGVVQGLTAVVPLQLIMVNNFGFDSSRNKSVKLFHNDEGSIGGEELFDLGLT